MPSTKAKEIFFQAIEHDGDLGTFLDQACGDDKQLRGDVEELVAAHGKVGGFLGGGASTRSFAKLQERPGSAIDSYKLLQQIGEGGFGVVYLAEQTEPVRRKVALKIIKPGMDTKDVIARFEAERQALAMMDHPNIAKVLDGGTTDSGRPYFVMELVKGIPLTDFCDKNKISTDGRLRLFASVCKAIQHAHNKGVIHRDIKPSNVMVTLHDGEPVPKVIDFGVAKAITSQLTEKTMFTAYGQMIGTPQYMSPEQAEMSGLDIDTRSDVYSLGVLLYELLTGTTPLTSESIRGKAYAEMQRMIREDEAPRPSIRLSSLGDASASTAANRGAEIGKLGTLVRGELDWIVMKSLEKNRERRYETATSFAADVERFLQNEAVEACPPSLPYKLSKLAKKHRKVLAAAASFALLLAASSLVGWYLFIDAKQSREVAESSKDQIREERDAAVLAQKEAEQARELAVEEKKNAQREQNRAVAAEAGLTKQLYNHSILLAAQAFDKNDLQRTRELLDESPQELRNWEWKWLSRQVHERFEPMYRPQHDVVFNKFDYSPDGRHLVELTRKGGKQNCLVLKNAKTLDEIWSIETGPEVGPSWAPHFTTQGNYILIQHADYSEAKNEHIGRGVPMKGTLDEATLARDVIHTATGKVVLKLGEGIIVPTPDDSQLRFIPGSLDAGEGVEIATYLLSGANADLVGTAQLPLPERSFGQRARCARRFSDDLKHVFTVEVSTEFLSPSHVSCWSTDESKFVWEKEIKFPSENLGRRELLMGLDQENAVLVVQPVTVAPGEIVRKQIPATRFDANSGDVISSFACPLEDARYHVMSRDGRFVASSNSGRTTVVWDPATGMETGRYLNNSQIGFKPTLRSNTLWTEAGRIKFDVESQPFELSGHRGRIVSLAFDESGEQLISTSADETLRTWDVERGRELTCTPVRLPGIARTSSGVVAYKSQGGVRVAPLRDPSDSRLLEDSRMAQPLWMRDGQILGMRRNAFVVWDQESGQPVREFELPLDELNPFKNESPNRLQGTMYDWVTKKDIGYPHGFSSDGTRAVAVGRRGKLIACDLQTGESKPKDLGLSRSAAIRPPIFHPNRNDCVAIVDGRDIHLLDLEEERKLMRLYGHPAVIVCTTFNSDGSRFYSIDRQGGLAVWNTENGEQLLFLPNAVSSGQPVVVMAVSPNGNTLALADFDRIRLLEVGLVSDEMSSKRSIHREAAFVVDQCHEQTRLTSRTLELIRDNTQLTPEVRDEAIRVAQTRGDLCFDSAMLGMGPRLRQISDLVAEQRLEQAARLFTELVDEAVWLGSGESLSDWKWRASGLARNWVNIDRTLGRESITPKDLAELVEKALELVPESHALWFVRSEDFMNHSDGIACRRALKKAADSAPMGSPYWHDYVFRLAILNLKLRDLEQYATNCKALFREAGKNSDPEVRAAAAIACLITTKSGHSIEEFGQLLASASDSSPTQAIARSLYAYRTGNYEQAIELCQATQLASASLLSQSISGRRSVSVRPSWTGAKYEGWAQASLTDLLRAMCFQQLGQEKPANRFLTQADQQKFNNLPFMWPHRFIFEVARREAADVFGEKSEYIQTSYGWSVAKRKPPYDRPYAARDIEVARTGEASGLIVGDHRVRAGKSYSLAQSISAIPYRGKRIQLKGFVRSERVLRFSGLWMSVEGSRESVPFDHMSDRPIRRTTDWQECSIVLDVPEDAANIVFGGQLAGRGKFWMDDLSLEVVDETVSTTGQERPPHELSDEQREKHLAVVKSHYREAPINLGFETPMRLLGLGLDVTGEELVVRNVLPNSIAEKAEFKVGQVVLAVGDEKVATMRSFIDLLHDGDHQKQITVRNEGEEQTIEVMFPY